MHSLSGHISQPSRLRSSWTIVAGAIIWALAWPITAVPLAEAILLLAPLVIVPLGLRLLNDLPIDRDRNLMSFANSIRFPAALILIVAFAMPTGPWAAALSTPWLAFTLILAVVGLWRIVRYVRCVDKHLALSAALVFIAVGGTWTFISRAGLRPMGFSDEIVLLTGVHFHYAGFALPVLTALAAGNSKRLIALPMILGVVIGVPAVGLGIAVSPAVELIASLVLVAACMLLAIVQLQIAIRSRQPTTLTLFAVSSMSLIAGMSLAAAYAIGEFGGRAWLDIPTMIPLHGVANSVGFAFCGLLAWQISAQLKCVDASRHS